jgi:hypothetical protein
MLPHNHDAEEALLGSLMVDSDSYYLISVKCGYPYCPAYATQSPLASTFKVMPA